MPGSVIVSGARTRIGKLNGALASVAPVELGGLAIAEALRRGGVPPEAVDYVIVAGGMESMSKAPHLLAGARAGIGYGDAALRDEIVVAGLTCSFEPLTMGAATERHAAAANVTRQEQDCGGGGQGDAVVLRSFRS